jgi:hypothetical protein
MQDFDPLSPEAGYPRLRHGVHLTREQADLAAREGVPYCAVCDDYHFATQPHRTFLAGTIPEEGVNPKDLIGVTKSPLRFVPPAGIAQAAKVMALGAKKYGPYNWRDYPIQNMVYVEAMLRHLYAYMDGQTIDPESGCNHLAHVAAGALIALDAEASGTLKDSRPKGGNAAEVMALQAKEKPQV